MWFVVATEENPHLASCARVVLRFSLAVKKSCSKHATVTWKDGGWVRVVGH